MATLGACGRRGQGGCTVALPCMSVMGATSQVQGPRWLQWYPGEVPWWWPMWPLPWVLCPMAKCVLVATQGRRGHAAPVACVANMSVPNKVAGTSWLQWYLEVITW